LSKLSYPSLKEQEKIAEILSTWDKAIEKQEKLQILNQKLIEKVVKILINDLSLNDGIEVTISDLLNYEQSYKYAVTTPIEEIGKTFVLTANKAFILGYTKEEENIFKIPAIVFDDFTADFKYFDLPFKVRSTAIKILTAKNDVDLLFVYYLMKTIRFNVVDHKRVFLSEYQNIKVHIPCYEKQIEIRKKIEYLYKSIDKTLLLIQKLKQQKKSLMQLLLSGIVRV